MLLGQPVKRPIAVVVRVSNEAAEMDDGGGTAALVETLTAGLEERGLRAQLFMREDDNPPGPRIEVNIEKWDPGDQKRRSGVAAATVLVPLAAFAQLGAQGEYSVLCTIVREGESQPAHQRRHSGLMFGITGSSSTSNGELVPSSILSDAFSDPGQGQRRRRGP